LFCTCASGSLGIEWTTGFDQSAILEATISKDAACSMAARDDDETIDRHLQVSTHYFSRADQQPVKS